MNLPTNLKYSPDHEWVRVENGVATIGITDYAQSELGEIVFVEVETVGETLAQGEVFGTVEAVKTVSDLLLPMSGEIIAFNESLEDTPELVNDLPFEDGWIVKVKITAPQEYDTLLTADDYKALIG